ncbi:MAG: arylamine N-acetyltransferase [Clostridiaceae bacterium]
MEMTEKQIEKYLKRIGYAGNLELKGETLRKLQNAHLKSIPYENLDILNNIPLSLEKPDLFHKIIETRRGGYCFELNSLFCCLLKSLNFKVTNFLGRFIIGESSIQMRRHRILKVEAKDGTYLCDVGVRNESPRTALIFAENLLQTDGFSHYKFVKEDFWGWVLWQKEKGKEWTRLYGFTEEPQLDIDYIMPSFYCEKHPDSDMNKFMKISIFTDTGRVSLVDRTLIISDGANGLKQSTLERSEEIIEVLKKYFGIITKLPD